MTRSPSCLSGSRTPVEILVRIVEDEEGTHHILAVRDLRERLAAEERIQHLVQHDALTGLGNRALFLARLEEEIVRAGRNQGMLALHTIDLDRFKEINDAYGHPAGDELQVGRRIERLAKPGDVVARLGGDEFVVAQVALGEPAEAVAFAERLVSELAAAFTLEGVSASAPASVGVPVYPSDGATADALLRSADMALYRAKSEGRGAFRTFEASMADDLRQRRALQKDLEAAINEGQLALVYQPQVRVADTSVHGFEALVRWTHPTLGAISPGTFIPLAEEAGLVGRLGEFVLRSACREAASRPQGLSIAVNLSPLQFSHGDLAALVQTILLETGLPAPRLELEITESVLIRDINRALHVLRQLKNLGVRIAMDDFGTGYSSLSYLQTFPFDKIKIDRSFISDLESNAHSRAIVKAVVGLARSLGIPVPAEGVETGSQLDVLKSELCDEVQGYLTGRPQPISAYDAVIRSERPGEPSRLGRLGPSRPSAGPSREVCCLLPGATQSVVWSRRQRGHFMDTGVVDRPEQSRFELPVENDFAVAYYRLDGDRITLTHTEVPQHLSGQGIGSRLAKGVFEAIRANGRRAVAKCPFMASYASRHPEYAGLLDG